MLKLSQKIGLCSGGVFRLGLQHLHMMQEILRIKDKLNHALKNTNTWLLDKQPLNYSLSKQAWKPLSLTY